MMNNLYLLAELSKKAQSKFLIWLVVILLFAIVVIGVIAEGIKKSLSRRAKEIDLYITDYCKVGLLKKPNDVVKYVQKRETKNLYFKNKWFILSYLILLVAFILIVSLNKTLGWAEVWQVIKDLGIKLHWPTSKFYFFKNFPTDFPQITKAPIVHLDFMGYSVYVMLVATIAILIRLLDQGALYTNKILRARKIKVDAFQKTIDINKGI